MSDLPQIDGFSPLIALRKSDGLHAFTGWRGNAQGYPEAKVWMWTKTNTLREHVLPSWTNYLNSSTCAFTGNNSLVVAGFYKAGGAPPMRIAEYSLATQPFTLLSMIDYGDDNMRSPLCIGLASGGVLVITYQQVGPPIFLRTAYLAPGPRPHSAPGGALPSPWLFTDFTFDMPGSEIPSMLYSVAQQNDGTIWLFMSRDGSGKFALARFRENAGVIENIDFIHDYFWATFVDGKLRDGDMSPGEELPPLRSTPDPAGNRILLTYPTWGSQPICTSYYEHNVITACYPDLRRELLAKLPDMMWKFTPVGCAYPTSKGVDYMVSGIDPATCVVNWRTGSVNGGVITPDKPLKYVINEVTFAPDGNVAFNLDGQLEVAKAADLSKHKPT